MSSIHGLDLIVQFLPVIIPLALIELGLLAGALVHLLRRGKAKLLPVWGWVLIIVLVNIIGPVLYFIIGREDA